MKQYRPISGYMDLNLTDIPVTRLHTNRSHTEEIFSSLQYLSEIEEVGTEFIRNHGTKDIKSIKKTFLLFQAFIRQGRTFYNSAESLEYRAQPLFYYYSFMNLAKAYLCIKKPALFNNDHHFHGLAHKYKNTKFTDQTIATNNGIFSELYKAITTKDLDRKLPLNISSLLGYVSEVGHEYNLVNYGESKIIPVISKICSDNTNYWSFLAMLNNDQIFRYKKYFTNFISYYEQVIFDKDAAKNMFNINAQQFKSFIFFQSKDTYVAD